MFNFNDKTNLDVQRVINSAYNAKQRVRIVLGDNETGEDWLEEHDVIGTIGRSTGSIKTPLLIKSSRSLGGCAISTDCILKIVDVKSKRTLYEAKNYQKPVLVKCASQMDDYMYDIYVSKKGCNTLQARFKTEKQANNYIDFIHCKRMAK